MTAATSGGLGDVVYSIPVMRELGVKKVYVKESYYYPPYGSLLTSIKRLLEYEGFEVLPTSGSYGPMQYDPELRFDYDLDRFRLMPKRGRVWIPANMRANFKLPAQDYKPWLSLAVQTGDYTVLQVTNRWNGGKIDWKKIIEDITQTSGDIIFLGFKDEWEAFCKKFTKVLWLKTDDVMGMAEYVAGAKQVFCNQSVGLTLAQGLGKQYWLERNPGKTNCLTFAENEHLLNP